MAINVTCPKCDANIFIANAEDGAPFLEIKTITCIICEHEFQMKFVNYFDKQRN